MLSELNCFEWHPHMSGALQSQPCLRLLLMAQVVVFPLLQVKLRPPSLHGLSTWRGTDSEHSTQFHLPTAKASGLALALTLTRATCWVLGPVGRTEESAGHASRAAGDHT